MDKEKTILFTGWTGADYEWAFFFWLGFKSGFCWFLEDRWWLMTSFFWVVREAGMKLGSDTKLMQDNNGEIG